jgi:hypothetical protein
MHKPNDEDDQSSSHGEVSLSPDRQAHASTNRWQKLGPVLVRWGRNFKPAVTRNIRKLGRRFMNVIRWADDHNGAITALATVLIAVLTIFYVSYAKKQWDEMRNARRPWIGMSERLTLKRPPSFNVLDEESISSLEGHKNMVTVDFELEGTIRNFGSSPARRQYQFFEMLAYANIRHEFQESSCKFAEGQSTGVNPYPSFLHDFANFSSMPTKAIFPDVSLPIQSQPMSVGIFPEDTGKSVMPHTLWIVGCIVYQDTSGGVHHTKVLYHSVSPRASKEEVAIYHPLLKWKPITEFIMEDSDAD